MKSETVTTIPAASTASKNTPIYGTDDIGEWRDGGKAPFNMYRGDAVVDGNVAYFMNYDGKTCSYNATTKRVE